MRPDDPLIDQNPGDPQSWNLYTYVRNNPLNNLDPSGEACVRGAGGQFDDDQSPGQICAQVDEADKNYTFSAVVTANAPRPSVPPLDPANNGPSWWGSFAKNLFSWKNFTDEFKQGGCVNVFGKASADALNPFSPSLS
jgi:uncharacterized protein RhaS with RHS repeats